MTGAAVVGCAAGPYPRDKRSGELDAGDEADHERAEAQAVVHMQRRRRHGDADDEKGDKDRGNQRR